MRACYMLSRSHTPSSLVRERERESEREIGREIERGRKWERERVKEKEKEKGIERKKRERCRIWLLNLFHCF